MKILAKVIKLLLELIIDVHREHDLLEGDIVRAGREIFNVAGGCTQSQKWFLPIAVAEE